MLARLSSMVVSRALVDGRVEEVLALLESVVEPLPFVMVVLELLDYFGNEHLPLDHALLLNTNLLEYIVNGVVDLLLNRGIGLLE